MAVAFSGNEDECINRKVSTLDGVPQSLPVGELEYFYELERCSNWIKKNSFRNVGLLLPQNLLPDRDHIENYLVQNSDCAFYFMDVQYPRCCFNEKSTTRFKLDGMIHFDHSCLTQHSVPWPVLYIFGKKSLDVDHAVEEFTKTFPDRTSHVIILYEVFYNDIIDKLAEKLKHDYDNILTTKLSIPCHQPCMEQTDEEVSYSTKIRKCGRYFPANSIKDLNGYDVFYVGTESNSLHNLMITLNISKFHCYDTIKKKTEASSFSSQRFLRQRYHYIERAKDARVMGVIVSSTTLPKCIEILDHLRDVIRKSGKKARMLHMTEPLSTQKLGNYLEVEMFVYVACPENSLVDCRELYQPVITPYELEIALNTSRQWNANYITDYTELLTGGISYVPLTVKDESEVDVSLITGRPRSVFHMEEDVSSTSVAVRDKMKIANIGPSAEFLANRSWRGLEQHLGETPVAEIVQGMKGIASAYEGEGEFNSTPIQNDD